MKNYRLLAKLLIGLTIVALIGFCAYKFLGKKGVFNNQSGLNESLILNQLLEKSAPSWDSSTWVKPVPEEMSQKYVLLWEELFKNKNKISKSYLDKNIKVIYKGISTTYRTWDKNSRTNGREYFIIVANFSLDWISINFVDELVIKESEETDYLSLETVKENPGFQEVHNLKPINKLPYSFKKVFEYAEKNSPKDGQLQYQYFTLLTDREMVHRGVADKEKGGIYLFLNGTADKKKEICINILINILNLETEKINQFPCELLK